MDMNYENAVESVLCTKEQIETEIKRVSSEISEYYADSDKKLLVLGILKGSVIFMADLVKELNLPLELDFMKLSSYGKGAVSNGNIVVKAGLERESLAEYNVLVVEDIIDTGNTLYWLVDYLKTEKQCGDVKICTLLDKPDRREKPIKSDFCCFCIPDEFAIGYGLDYNELYRDLPYVGVLKREIYEK